LIGKPIVVAPMMGFARDQKPGFNPSYPSAG